MPMTLVPVMAAAAPTRAPPANTARSLKAPKILLGVAPSMPIAVVTEVLTDVTVSR